MDRNAFGQSGVASVFRVSLSGLALTSAAWPHQMTLRSVIKNIDLAIGGSLLQLTRVVYTCHRRLHRSQNENYIYIERERKGERERDGRGIMNKHIWIVVKIILISNFAHPYTQTHKCALTHTHTHTHTHTQSLSLSLFLSPSLTLYPIAFTFIYSNILVNNLI